MRFRQDQVPRPGGGPAWPGLLGGQVAAKHVAEPLAAATGRAAGATDPTEGWLARSRWSTWQPRRRTHLLCVGLSGLLTLGSVGSLYPWTQGGALRVLLGGVGVALVSVWPLGGTVLALVASALDLLAPLGHQGPVLPLAGPWLCSAVLLTRGFRRSSAYGAVVLNALLLAAALRVQQAPAASSSEVVQLSVVIAGTCLVVAELVRQPRSQTEAGARQHRADLEHQRLLVVSELHDTVVRDLTQAVMTAEQARLSSQSGESLAGALAEMTASVRTAVEQLRGSLRALGEAGTDDGATAGGAARSPGSGPGAATTSLSLDVLASSAPRPLAQSVAAAQKVLAARGIALEASGLEVLDRPEVSPGMRQQLTRVLNELVANVTKYAAPGSARLLVECDGRSVEALVSNATAADGSGRDAGAATSSGLGLVGARRRTEALGGEFVVTRGEERFTVLLTVALGR